MTNPPAGWYDDPGSPAELRYWDGNGWGHQTAPRLQPLPAPGSIPGSRLPAQYVTPGPTTPDGVPLAGYGSRVGAFLLDRLITGAASGLLSIPFMGGFLEWYRAFVDSARAGGRMDPAELHSQLVVHLWPLVALITAVYVAYELFFLMRFGATPGKMALHIAVRDRNRPGPLTLVRALRRVALYLALILLQMVPVVGTVAGLIGLLDLLFPLWDRKRQALHDKIAGTNVVQRHRWPTPGAP